MNLSHGIHVGKYLGKSYEEMDDLGVPPFQETTIWCKMY
jgi:hypothetical protein